MKTFFAAFLGVTLGVLLGGILLVWSVEKCPWLHPKWVCPVAACNCNPGCTCEKGECTCTPDEKCSEGCTCNKAKK